MTTPNPTVNDPVKALEYYASPMNCTDTIMVPDRARAALPLAIHNAEAEVALRWLVKNFPTTMKTCLSKDCPAIIREMLGEKHG